jgi:hypothetical protein
MDAAVVCDRSEFVTFRAGPALFKIGDVSQKVRLKVSAALLATGTSNTFNSEAPSPALNIK